MNIKEISDSELIHLIKEESEEAKDIIYEKYHYIIGIIIKKYLTAAKINNIEYNDLYQEALLGFSDALNRYDENNSSLPTFITLCVDLGGRRIINRKNSKRNKRKK